MEIRNNNRRSCLKFYSSVRIDVRKIESLKDGARVIGSRHRAKIVKNKVSAPFRIAEFDVMADSGISKEGGIVDVGVEMEIIGKSGAFFRFGDLMLGQGKEATKMFLKEKPDIAKKIIDEIMKKSVSAGTPVAVGIEEKEAA